MSTTTTLRPTYRQNGSGWTGAIKDETGKLVWECPHFHKNRDQGSASRGPSATDCARAMLSEVGKGHDGEGFIDGRAGWKGVKVELRGDAARTGLDTLAADHARGADRLGPRPNWAKA